LLDIGSEVHVENLHIFDWVRHSLTMASTTAQPAAAVGYGTSKGAALTETLATVQSIVDDSAKWPGLECAMESTRTLMGLLDNMQKLQPANVPVDAMVTISADAPVPIHTLLCCTAHSG